jgi:hypothetical protein
MKSRQAQRSAEIILIMTFLLIVFSVAGMPMILLSTFSPSLIADDLELDGDGAMDGLGSAVAA